jgi:HemK-like putative methylase
MPRLSHTLLLRAFRISPLLPLVLRGTRNLESAVEELRWLREHVEDIGAKKSERWAHKTLLGLCQRRSRGEPLQYILGSQPFGELDIKCRSGVLIPRFVDGILSSNTCLKIVCCRPETEAYTIYLAEFLLGKLQQPRHVAEHRNLSQRRSNQALKIVDLCTGTGCIPLLLHSLLSPAFEKISTVGWDISQTAVCLAKANLSRNKRIVAPRSTRLPNITFDRVDVFSIFNEEQLQSLKCDILISNPPYISTQNFTYGTTRSVRNWEPKLALVPSILRRGNFLPQDVFYDRLIDLHFTVCGSKILVMEVGDDHQAVRIAKLIADRLRSPLSDNQGGGIEIWRDSPDATPESHEDCKLEINGYSVTQRGSGALRAVVLLS